MKCLTRSAGLLMIAASAGAETFVLRGGVVANGRGTVRSLDDSYLLDDTFGEAVNPLPSGANSR